MTGPEDATAAAAGLPVPERSDNELRAAVLSEAAAAIEAARFARARSIAGNNPDLTVVVRVAFRSAADVVLDLIKKATS